jgi:hypothetical protein
MQRAGRWRLWLLLGVGVLGLWLARATPPVRTDTVVSSAASDPAQHIMPSTEREQSPRLLD